MWQELGVALGLVLILEGLLPFLVPTRWREMLAQVATLDDRTIRLIGLAALLGGTALVYMLTH